MVAAACFMMVSITAETLCGHRSYTVFTTTVCSSVTAVCLCQWDSRNCRPAVCVQRRLRYYEIEEKMNIARHYNNVYSLCSCTCRPYTLHWSLFILLSNCLSCLSLSLSRSLVESISNDQSTTYSIHTKEIFVWQCHNRRVNFSSTVLAWRLRAVVYLRLVYVPPPCPSDNVHCTYEINIRLRRIDRILRNRRFQQVCMNWWMIEGILIMYKLLNRPPPLMGEYWISEARCICLASTWNNHHPDVAENVSSQLPKYLDRCRCEDREGN